MSSFIPGREGVEALPYGGRVAWVDGQRYCAAPTSHQPLSHGALRRDSSPFRGAEGWADILALYAHVYHDADTFVPLTPVRGGVPDAPRWCDRRGGFTASVRPARQHARLIRRARLRPPPHVCNPAGTARAPFVRANRGSYSTQAGRAWKPSPTVDWVGISAKPTLPTRAAPPPPSFFR